MTPPCLRPTTACSGVCTRKPASARTANWPNRATAARKAGRVMARESAKQLNRGFFSPKSKATADLRGLTRIELEEENDPCSSVVEFFIDLRSPRNPRLLCSYRVY